MTAQEAKQAVVNPFAKLATWLKTTAGIVASLVALGGTLVAGGNYAIGALADAVTAQVAGGLRPSIEALEVTVESNTAALRALEITANGNAEAVEGMGDQFASLEKKIQAIQPNREAAIRFADFGHTLGDGRAGDVVMISLRFEKLRADCDAPAVRISQIDAENATLNVDPVDFNPVIRPAKGGYQEITYPVRLPPRAATGRAKTRVAVKHGCIEGDPDPVTSPEITSRILPSD